MNENQQRYCRAFVCTQLSCSSLKLLHISAAALSSSAWSRSKREREEGRRTIFWEGAGSRDSTRNFLSSGTNVTGETHQSTHRSFAYCQKTRVGKKKSIEKKKQKKQHKQQQNKNFPAGGGRTLQSCRGSDRGERLWQGERTVAAQHITPGRTSLSL